MLRPWLTRRSLPINGAGVQHDGAARAYGTQHAPHRRLRREASPTAGSRRHEGASRPRPAAASVPAGFDAHGLSLAVQLCGRPGDEVTLLHVGAQLEEARPWADRRPPVDGPTVQIT